MASRIINNLGRVIIVRLYEMGKTQGWLAEQCNVTPTSISMIINGKRHPSKKLLYGISLNLKIPYEDVLSLIGDCGNSL